MITTVISKDLINLVYPNIKEVLGTDYSFAIDKEVHYVNNKYCLNNII